MTVDEAVWVDPDRMSGVPCLRGSRLPVQQVFDWLADGVSLDEFVADSGLTGGQPKRYCELPVPASPRYAARASQHS